MVTINLIGTFDCVRLVGTAISRNENRLRAALATTTGLVVAAGLAVASVGSANATPMRLTITATAASARTAR